MAMARTTSRRSVRIGPVSGTQGTSVVRGRGTGNPLRFPVLNRPPLAGIPHCALPGRRGSTAPVEVDLDRCLRGDGEAWRALVERVAPVVTAAVGRCLRRHGADEVAVEDVVQEVFLRLVRDDFRALRAFDPARAQLTTWLTVVAHRMALDACRRRRPAGGELPADLVAPAQPPPSEGLPLGDLPPRQRLVLQLLFERDLSVEEAAAFLGVEAQTVRSLKHKALSRLRERLGGDAAAAADVSPDGRIDERR